MRNNPNAARSVHIRFNPCVTGTVYVRFNPCVTGTVYIQFQLCSQPNKIALKAIQLFVIDAQFIKEYVI